ncbi:MAG: recombinase RecT [Desulfosporosinus sp.]|nr:recombinase RecT [Desulfosporosinus sp.]
MSKALTVIEGNQSLVEGSPSRLIEALSPRDKATIMSLCMPSGANDSELALYLYRCKEQGFDPLSGELVLQKRISQKDGTVKLSFITTRDALLKKAELNPNYGGMNSGVVKENDNFQVDTEKGTIHQDFGAKRGKIIAGWAVVYHKNRLPVIAIADYAEYAAANANSPVWRSMPSAMVQKVAEVAALRRQFPILTQGVYTTEELQTEAAPTPNAVLVEKPVQEASVTKALKGEVRMLDEEPELYQEPVSQTVQETELKAQVSVEAPEEVLPTAPVEATDQPQDAYKLLGLATGKSGTGTPYAKLACEYKGQKLVLLAKGEEGLAEAGKLSEGCYFQAEIVEDKGFSFVQTITVK